MNVTEDLIEKLNALRGRSSSSTLRELMPVIDPQIRRGVRHEDILATLYAGGIDVNIHTFRSALYAYRKRQREGGVREEPRGGKTLPSEPAPHQVEPIPAVTSDAAFEEALNPRTRDELTQKYMAPRPLFKRNRK